jgi:uncharacterized protein (TIGR02246 family)
MRLSVQSINQATGDLWLRLPRTRSAWARAKAELAVILTGALTLMFLTLVLPVRTLAGPAEEANAVIDRWQKAYSENDPAAVVNLYTPDAVLFGTVSPIIFDGTEPLPAAFGHLAENANKVSISRRQILVLFDDSVLVRGSYEFTSIERGLPRQIPAGFTMLVIKRDGRWLISYHTSYHLLRVQ